VDDRVRAIMKARADEDRERRRREGLGWKEAEPLLAALENAGIDTVDFGIFGPSSFTTFDFERAAPILVDWLPRVDDPQLKLVIVSSLAGQKAARGEGARRLVGDFRRPEYHDKAALRWAIGDTLATIAGPGDADGIIDLLRDRSGGRARQMLCDALVRTRDPRRVDVLIDLIADDDVAGHAISALRRIGRGVIPAPERVRPMLQAVLVRPAATDYAKRQARTALKKLG
jgi:HEAT repeat protein